MSDTEQIQSFSPLMILIWVLNIIVVAMDYSPDQRITWSIPVVGSVIVVQVYMIWKTNYDQMVQEQREVQAQKLGGFNCAKYTINPTW